MDFKWTGERVAHLKEMTAAGAFASQVAREFNLQYGASLTRNAVLGKLDRLNVKRPKRVKAEPKPKAKEPRARVSYLPHLRQMAAGVPEPERGPLPFTGDPTEIPPEQRRSLLDLTNETCRWPYGEPGQPDFFFCGALEADCSGGKPFCPSHSAMAYHQPKPVSDTEHARRQQHGQWLARAAARKRAAA